MKRVVQILGKSNATRVLQLQALQTPYLGVSKKTLKLSKAEALKISNLYQKGYGISNKQLNEISSKFYRGDVE